MREAIISRLSPDKIEVLIICLLCQIFMVLKVFSMTTAETIKKSQTFIVKGVMRVRALDCFWGSLALKPSCDSNIDTAEYWLLS